MINSRDISDLHTTLQRGAKEFIKRMEAKGYPVLITSTYRDNESQNALFAQGRTAPGKIVTNARGGQSIHNYRLAFDICKNVKGQEYSDSSFFNEAGAVWTVMGGEWGGLWPSFPDRPHMQYTGGLTLSDLQCRKILPISAKMPWEDATSVVSASAKNQIQNALPISESDKSLICKVVYWEARGEDEKGKMLIVYVILNRVKAKGFPNSIKDVIYQSGAFSPVKRPDFEQTEPTKSVVDAVEKALLLKDTISQEATYFANDAGLTAPFFVAALEDGRILKLFKHGGHTFLK